ncbi:Sodium leak channel non-selective protein [Amphibalanus amphitrite]|uniref:Sodium leak channel NALCN n=1 Tax=Amphibalanus amphitrite TaxID=1232801 RepID=A0A6A4WH73_AMPAM|nr:Sodium leak channel non-selective protein [Amphibalanus amphitrite]
MCLYALLGVQFFGKMNNHCVKSGTDPRYVTLNDLAIPDTYCSTSAGSGYQCPPNMTCVTLDDPQRYSSYNVGFNGFDEFATSIFTVYEASSQEGWVYVMYRAVDSLPSWRGLVYFTTMIFFLAWLVKNVFIAVIMETFNEIRVQFQQMWGTRGQISEEYTTYVLTGTDTAWKLVTAEDSGSRGSAPLLLQRVIQSAGYHLVVMAAILTNAYISSSVQFLHDGRSVTELYKDIYPIEVGFTIFFDLEVLVKVWCMGFSTYWKRSIHKFEAVLAVGSTFHLLPNLYNSVFTYFQVLRIVRLIKASPLLEDFVFKIFGPGKKLGSLIIFTMCLLIITSSISMQLFCFLDFQKFETFPAAFMSMFQILTQEAWVDVMDETMYLTASAIVPLVAIYFILYHLFVTLIVLSLFVAVILDNLELDEDIKKLRQLRAREQSAGIQETLPLRLRIFEKFPDRPQMARLHKVPADFTLQKVRESFMRNFVDDPSEEEDSPGMKASSRGREVLAYRRARCRQLLHKTTAARKSDYNQKSIGVRGLVDDCNNHRLLLGDSGQLPTTGKGLAAKSRFENAKSMRRSMRGSLKVKQTYDHLKENGDVAALSGGGSNARNPHDFDIKLLQAKRQQAEMKRNQREEDLRENHPYFDTPLFVIGRESRFRKVCQMIVNARYNARQKDPVTGQERKVRYKGFHNLLGLVTYLDWAMILITTVSCASMMFESPFFKIQDNWQLQVSEYLFVVGMSIELALKVLADGLLFTPKSLIRDIGGLLDLFIYVVSLVFLMWMPTTVPPVSWEQLLLIVRCLRPLRIVYLVPHMRTVVRELCRGFKEILLVSVLLILLLYVFASYGVQLFGGRLARCNDPDPNYQLRQNCVGFFQREIFVTKMKISPRENETYPVILVPRVWANPRRFNFDKIGNAMLALFEVLSFKGWLDIRDVLIKRLGPVQSIYIHIFVFIGCMIGLTLFVGVVIANYSENKGTALLTVDQRRWCDLKKRLKIAQPLHLPPRPDGRRWRAVVYDFTQNIIFKRFVAVLVIINSSLICVQWDYAQPYTRYLAVVSSILNLFFMMEVVMKMVAFSARGYWQSRRNRYDLFVTVLGLVWVILNFTFPMVSDAFVSDSKVQNNYTNSLGFICIILRFFTITGKHATLKMLMLTVVVSVYKSFFIIMGMFLLLLSYAFAGTILFGTVKYGEGIGRQANFKTAPSSIVMLFRIVTGEDWNQIMHDCMVEPPSCTVARPPDYRTDCGNFTVALVFFCSFYVIITYIVLNLLVAIIMENFSLFYSNEEDALLSYADIRNFQNTWNVVDKNQRGVIPVRKVKFILRLLKGRLEVDPQKDRLLFKHMCYELERLHNGDEVTFHDVLNMLSYRSVDIRKSLQLEELLAREELEYIIEEEVAKQTIRQWLDGCLKRIRAREQSSLIAGLRATNEQALMRLNEERKQEREKEEKEEPSEPPARQRKKGVCMGRSDSVGSAARKFLTPSLSDATATKDKERPAGKRRTRSVGE